MRIIVHDYAGHPFQVQLSRGLAERGHRVLHVYSGSTMTPRGELSLKVGDPDNFDIREIQLSRMIPKYDFFARYRLESQYAAKLAELAAAEQPDVILSANTPSIVQHRLMKQCRRRQTRLVTWVQDLYGLAAYRVLKKKLPGLGHVIGQTFVRLDQRSYRGSHANVVITEDFASILLDWGVPAERVHTIHNWAPLDALPLEARDNAWSREQQLRPGLRFLYSGTLSIRHNPELLLRLAKFLEGYPEAELLVVSQGAGIEWLRQQAAERRIANLRFFDFQPFEAMAEVIGSADALVTILEPDAGVFCVPSKVLTYMCAGRPQLLAVPPENLAARLVKQQHCGLVADPRNVDDFLESARTLCDNADLRRSLGDNARGYAEDKFDIDQICSRFEAVLSAEPAAVPRQTVRRGGKTITPIVSSQS